MNASPLPAPDPPADSGGTAGPAATPAALPGTEADLSELLLAHNRQLSARGIRLRLEQRGRSLGLRGPLPRPDGAAGLRMQRLSLGISADLPGLTLALQRLEQLQQELQDGHFRWEHWRRRGEPQPTPSDLATGRHAQRGLTVLSLRQPPPRNAAGRSRRTRERHPGSDGSAGTGPVADAASCAAGSPLAEALEAFEAAFFAESRRRRVPAGSRSTWQAAYRPYLRRLEQLAGPAPLSAALLERTLESYSLASRSRQQCGIALAALASQQGLELPADWSERCGGYGLHRARFRQLPSDSRILELVDAIPNPAWRLAYGLMATYGLRNHEVFFCDCSGLARGGDRVLRVLPTSKTGEHQVWPFQPDWVERFGLERLGDGPGALPPVRTDLRHTTLKQVGQRVAEQFRRYALPISPYDLRHAWAVRTIHIGLPDTVAARMMGHSVTIHTRTYHHWITRRDQQQAVDAALARLRSA